MDHTFLRACVCFSCGHCRLFIQSEEIHKKIICFSFHQGNLACWCRTFSFHLQYPVLPWIGIMALGYCFGSLYAAGYDQKKRKKILVYTGISSMILFIILRSGNFYGDASHWSVQKNPLFGLLSFLNVTKYPPSLLYVLMTLGPSFIFLALAEGPVTSLKEKIIVFGRVPMFYYLAHILLIHVFAMIGAVILGYKWSDMILTTMINRAPALKG